MKKKWSIVVKKTATTSTATTYLTAILEYLVKYLDYGVHDEL